MASVIEKILSCIGRPVRFTYPGDEGQKLGVLKDRSVTTSGPVGLVPYWDVVDLIEFDGENEPMIRISYYRKPKDRLIFAGQTSITEPVSTWQRMLVTAAREKEWFANLLETVLGEVRQDQQQREAVATTTTD